MRPFLRWLIHGKPSPPVVIRAEWSESNPKEEAIIAIAATLEAQSLLIERFAVAAESVVATLDRAEQRAIAGEQAIAMIRQSNAEDEAKIEPIIDPDEDWEEDE